MIDEEKIEKLKAWMDDARSVVFFGGAGVSTESGVPDFRSKDGLYNQHDVRFDQYPPEYLLSHSCLVNEPQVYFEFHRQKMDTRAVQPNAAHKYLAALEKTGKLSAIVTPSGDCGTRCDSGHRRGGYADHRWHLTDGISGGFLYPVLPREVSRDHQSGCTFCTTGCGYSADSG